MTAFDIGFARRGRGVALLGLACLALCGNARADEWALESSVDLQLRHTDNLDLRAGDSPIANTTASISPRASFFSRSEAREIKGSLGLSANAVSNDAATSTLDYSAAVQGTWRPDELNQLGLSTHLVRDSTQQSELAATGVVLARYQRTQLTLAPSWQRALDERTTLSVGYQGTSVRYEAEAGLADYTDQNLSLGLRRLVSERLSVSATATQRWFRADPLTQPRTVSATTLLLAETTNTTRTSGLSLGIQFQASERLQLNADVGVQGWKTDQRQRLSTCVSPFLPGLLFPIAACRETGFPLTSADSDAESSSRTSTYGADGSYRFETGDVSFALGRSATASGSGALLQTDRISGGLRGRWSDTLAYSVDTSAVRSRTPDGQGSESRYFRFSPALSWRIDPQISLDVGIATTRQRSGAGAPTARANEIFVSLSYRLDPLSISR